MSKTVIDFQEMETLEVHSDRMRSKWSDHSLYTLDTNGNVCDKLSRCDSADILTIENLRQYNNSCLTCGVSWYEDHVSLDCDECGGYAMMRPCPVCDGQCESMWRRNSRDSHLMAKAVFEGECKLNDNSSTRTTSSVSLMEKQSLNSAL